MVQAGGVALVVGAIAFMEVFAFLAVRFDYPAILDGPAGVVLPKLLATGPAGRAVWTLHAFLPLIWLPAGVGAYRALERAHPAAMLLALQCSVLAAISMILGLARWPTIHWWLAEQYVAADPGHQRAIGALFDGLNTYLGNYLGELLGELAFNSFFLLSAWALLRSRRTAPWIAHAGLLTGVAGLLGIFRNFTPLVAPIAAINHYLFPLWMMVFGIVLLRLGPEAGTES